MSVSNALAEALSQLSKQQSTSSSNNWGGDGTLLAGLGYLNSQQSDAAQQGDAHDTALIPGLAGLYEASASNSAAEAGVGLSDFGMGTAGTAGQNGGASSAQTSNLGAQNSGLLSGGSSQATVPGDVGQAQGQQTSNGGQSADAGNGVGLGPGAPHVTHHPHHQFMGPPPPGAQARHMQQLPNYITVTPSTDPMQAAGLINFTFTQSHHSFFLLNCRAEGGVTGLPVLNAALNVVLSARKISQQALARFDLGFVPFLVTDAAESVGLLIYKCNINPELAKLRGQVLKMEASSNPLVAGLSLFNMLQSSPQQLEVIFTADAARVALQALAIMRINLANNGRDVLLLASTIDYAADAAGPKSYCLLKLTPTSPPLPCFQHQIDLPKPPAFDGEPAMLGRYALGPRNFDQGMPGRMHAGPGMKVPGPYGAPPMLGPGAASPVVLQKPRARKADYVIVTEDTAIKNAAGAVAKVLGRVSNQGQCCPVYTEKKTESFTTVISVAVKAIAVARGYVCNEGMGHEVGFQPYLRNLDKRMDLLDLHQYMMEKKMMQFSKGGMHSAMMMKEQLEFNLDEDSMSDERCELAFDVFKVQQMPELQEAGNLPVKVTAHSRPNVVSNIISKLVSEREGAVLITAGGKAMHVAMTAVVSARARLKAKGIDVLLLPKFVTVDTTSTLGWESVFLRFNIVRWMPALVSSSDTALAASGVPTALQDTFTGRFMLTPTVG